MKKMFLLFAVLVSVSSFAVTEDQRVQAYETIAARYPALILNLFKSNQDKEACQKAYVLDLTREGYESATLGPKLQQHNPWVYRNFLSSFGDLKVITTYCREGGNRADALRAAESVFANSTLE